LKKETRVLDSFNRFAKSAHIVTPFSSIIALVNKRQMADLERASKQKDRYSYEVIDASDRINWSHRHVLPNEGIEYSVSDVVKYILWFIIFSIAVVVIGGVASLAIGFFKRAKNN